MGNEKEGGKTVGKMKAYLVLGAVTVLTFVANISAALACTSLHYQPEVPEKLTGKYC